MEMGQLLLTGRQLSVPADDPYLPDGDGPTAAERQLFTVPADDPYLPDGDGPKLQ